MADSSSIEKPLPTHSGTSPWILDIGAYFHMTYDSSTLTSVRPVESPIRVLTADGTPLPVASRGTLSTSSFHVPSISHVPRLTMQLISGGQIVDSSCRVILDFDSCSIQDRRTGALLGVGPRPSEVSGSLTSFVFPPLPPPSVSQPLRLHLPALFSNDIIVLVIYVVLISRLWFIVVFWGLSRWIVWVVGLADISGLMFTLLPPPVDYILPFLSWSSMLLV